MGCGLLINIGNDQYCVKLHISVQQFYSWNLEMVLDAAYRDEKGGAGDNSLGEKHITTAAAVATKRTATTRTVRTALLARVR